MAFESIAEHIDKIEQMLSKGHSPKAIADALGIPKKRITIYRYKKEVFDLQGAAQIAWTEEQKKGHDERFEAGKARIIDSLELLNKAKLRADQLLDANLGDPYETAKGEQRALSLGSAAIYWDTGTKIAVQAIKQEMEISGDDPGSRRAEALEALSDAQLQAIIAATEEESE